MLLAKVLLEVLRVHTKVSRLGCQQLRLFVHVLKPLASFNDFVYGLVKIGEKLASECACVCVPFKSVILLHCVVAT